MRAPLFEKSSHGEWEEYVAPGVAGSYPSRRKKEDATCGLESWYWRCSR
jgi:hypothetical protein